MQTEWVKHLTTGGVHSPAHRNGSADMKRDFELSPAARDD